LIGLQQGLAALDQGLLIIERLANRFQRAPAASGGTVGLDARNLSTCHFKFPRH
jgi:hypothetical protein